MSDWRLIADATSAPLAVAVVIAYALDGAVETVRGLGRDSLRRVQQEIDERTLLAVRDFLYERGLWKLWAPDRDAWRWAKDGEARKNEERPR